MLLSMTNRIYPHQELLPLQGTDKLVDALSRLRSVHATVPVGSSLSFVSFVCRASLHERETLGVDGRPFIASGYPDAERGELGLFSILSVLSLSMSNNQRRVQSLRHHVSRITVST